MRHRQIQGQWGERLAESYLVRHGFRFVARNVRTRFGELDLVMEDGDELVFVEVKLRRSLRFGEPEEALTFSKRQHLIRAIDSFRGQQNDSRPYRCDVVAITVKGRRVVIRHLRGVEL